MWTDDPVLLIICTCRATRFVKRDGNIYATSLTPFAPGTYTHHLTSSAFSPIGKKPRTKAPRIQRLVTPRVLQHKRRRIALKRQRTQKNKEEASEYAKLLAKRMKVCICFLYNSFLEICEKKSSPSSKQLQWEVMWKQKWNAPNTGATVFNSNNV